MNNTVAECFASAEHEYATLRELAAVQKRFHDAKNDLADKMQHFIDSDPSFDDLLRFIMMDEQNLIAHRHEVFCALQSFIEEFIPHEAGLVSINHVGERSPRLQILVVESGAKDVTQEMLHRLSKRMSVVADVEITKITIKDEIDMCRATLNHDDLPASIHARTTQRLEKLLAMTPTYQG